MDRLSGILLNAEIPLIDVQSAKSDVLFPSTPSLTGLSAGALNNHSDGGDFPPPVRGTQQALFFGARIAIIPSISSLSHHITAWSSLRIPVVALHSHARQTTKLSSEQSRSGSDQEEVVGSPSRGIRYLQTPFPEWQTSQIFTDNPVSA